MGRDLARTWGHPTGIEAQCCIKFSCRGSPMLQTPQQQVCPLAQETVTISEP